MYLLDTNVVSELRRQRPHGAVLAWIASVPDHVLLIPSVVVGEIQIGLERAASTDAGKASEISAWLDAVVASSQVVSANAAIFRTWGKLIVTARSHLLVDALIAATAIEEGLTVVTRNVRDFADFGVPCLNPFEFRPDQPAGARP